ncbi:hypothetical protein BLA14095_03722 [Burkholderia lata]|nr:hypothetical protein BLA14095_03722 [Burkholderia lata]
MSVRHNRREHIFFITSPHDSGNTSLELPHTPISKLTDDLSLNGFVFGIAYKPLIEHGLSFL